MPEPVKEELVRETAAASKPAKVKKVRIEAPEDDFVEQKASRPMKRSVNVLPSSQP